MDCYDQSTLPTLGMVDEDRTWSDDECTPVLVHTVVHQSSADMTDRHSVPTVTDKRHEFSVHKMI